MRYKLSVFPVISDFSDILLHNQNISRKQPAINSLKKSFYLVVVMKKIFLLFAIILLTAPVLSQEAKLKVELKNTSQVFSMAVSPDGKWLATGTVGKVFLWDLEEGKLEHCITGLLYPVGAIGFTNNSKSLLLGMGNNNVEMWDMETMTKEKTFFGHNYMIKDLKVAPQGKYFASLDYKNAVILWDISKGKAIREFEIPSGFIYNISFSPTGKELIIGRLEGEIPFVDLASGETVKTLNSKRFGDDDFRTGINPDSLYMLSVNGNSLGNVVARELGKVISYHSKMIIMWDIASGKQDNFMMLDINPYGGVVSGNKLALRAGKEVRFIDLEKWAVIDSAKVTPGDYNTITCDPEGKYFMTGEMDGSVKFFETATGKQAMSLYAFDTTDWAVVTPDGYFDASLGAMGLLYYVDGLEIIPLEANFEKAYAPSLFRTVKEGKKVGSAEPGKDILSKGSTPPSVSMSAENASKVSKLPEEVVTATITNEGGGIDEVRIYQNGKLIDVKFFKDKQFEEGDKLRLNFTAEMVPGNNIFKATAFSNGRLEGKSQPIVIKYDAPKPASTLYILAAGVDKYENSKYNLSFAKADAQGIIGAFSGGENSLYKEVKVKGLYDENATIKNLRKAFEEIAAEAKPEDIFVFYFSGHGATDEDEEGNQTDFFFILHEVQQIYGAPSLRDPFALTGQELKEWSLKIKAQKQLILIDACQSGQALQQFAMRGPQAEKAIIELSKSRGLYVIAASEAEQTAKEVRELGHGVFTWSLMEGLKCNADFFEKDGIINVKELNLYMNKKVKELAQKYNLTPQRPVSWEYMNDFPVKVCE